MDVRISYEFSAGENSEDRWITNRIRVRITFEQRARYFPSIAYVNINTNDGELNEGVN